MLQDVQEERKGVNICCALVSGHCRASSEKEDFLMTTMVGVFDWM